MFKNLLSFAAVASVALASPAFAHAKLLSASPADGAQVAGSPKTLALSFSRPVTLAALSLISGGMSIPVAPDRGASPTALVTIKLPVLKAARYDVRWSVLSIGDANITKGTLSFTIVAPTPAKKKGADPGRD